MASKQEQLKWQAQDDAYTMARYQEIIKDKARAARATKVAAQQARDLEKQVKSMKAVANTKTRTTKKK